jgi:hypothetical protein
MKKDFKVGDHVGWNSEAGPVRGTIKKKITSSRRFKSYTVHASKEDPQYLIKTTRPTIWPCTRDRHSRTSKRNNERAENNNNLIC